MRTAYVDSAAAAAPGTIGGGVPGTVFELDVAQSDFICPTTSIAGSEIVCVVWLRSTGSDFVGSVCGTRGSVIERS